MFKTVLIDDESSGRDILSSLLKKISPDITVVAEAGNVEDAIHAIDKHHPDLVFLDVEMPTGSGFDVLEGIQSNSFEVIFITAFQEYAVEAFKYSAVDYLLKPINKDDLSKAVQKAIKQLELKSQDERVHFLLETLRSKSDMPKKIMLPTNDGFQLFHIDDISRCQSEGNYTRFFKTDGKTELVSKTMKEYESLLSQHGFFRIHRSHIINLKHIVRYIKGKGGEVVMSDGAVLDVSREKKDSLIKMLT